MLSDECVSRCVTRHCSLVQMEYLKKPLSRNLRNISTLSDILIININPPSNTKHTLQIKYSFFFPFQIGNLIIKKKKREKKEGNCSWLEEEI